MIPGQLPEGFGLTCQSNPSNPSTKIAYSLPEAGEETVGICNLDGQLIEILVESHREAGEYKIVWDASGQSRTVYFCGPIAGDFTRPAG